MVKGMTFEENNKAIYLQIADRICDLIMNGTYDSDNRIPSVREFATSIEVNANTVMRSYEKLASQGLIYNKRGIGFFVSEDAKIRILKERTENIVSKQFPPLFKLLSLIGFTPEDLKTAYERYLKEHQPSKETGLE